MNLEPFHLIYLIYRDPKLAPPTFYERLHSRLLSDVFLAEMADTGQKRS